MPVSLLFNSSISLHNFCLLVLLVPERGVLKCPAIIVTISVSSFNCISFFSMHSEALLQVH